jgi:hypothetical protein
MLNIFTSPTKGGVDEYSEASTSISAFLKYVDSGFEVRTVSRMFGFLLHAA